MTNKQALTITFLFFGTLIGGVFLTTAYAAPISNVLGNILPISDSLYDIGTTTAKFNRGFFNWASTTSLTTTATSTMGGISLSGGCFKDITGSCLTSGTTLSGGTTNWLTYWTSATAISATSSPSVASLTVGYLTATSTTASTFAGLLSVTGAGTSTFSGGLSAAGLSSSNGLTITGGSVIFPGSGVWTSAGNVGIGTTSPSAKFSITGGGTGTGRMVAFGNSANTEKFTILDNGKIFIGTSNSVFSVSGDIIIGQNVSYRVSRDSDGETYNIAKYSTSNGRIEFGDTNNASAFLSGSNIQFAPGGASRMLFGHIITTGTDPGETTFPNNKGINALNAAGDGTIELIKGTDGNKIVIGGDGNNVGIGTTSPSGKFSITGGGTGTGRMVAFGDSANTERFTILDNGNVGIGTTTPGSLLSLGNTGGTNLFAAGTSTFAGGVKLTAGCFMDINGTCLTAGGAGTPGGSDGQIQYNNGGAFGGATFFFLDDNNSRIGIGTTTPNVSFVMGSSTPAYNPEVVEPWRATVTINLNTGNHFKVILAGATTLTLSNGWAGQSADVTVCQDATGGRTITNYTNPILWPGATTTLSETANKCNLLSILVSSGTTTSNYLVTGLITGY